MNYSFSQQKSTIDGKSIFADNTHTNHQIAVEVEDLIERVKRIEKEMQILKKNDGANDTQNQNLTKGVPDG